jgi:predicted TIM-barrel fold metal-dependent hydrolase
VTSFPNPDAFLDENQLRDPDVATSFARLVNDRLAAIHAEHPERLYAFASVPLVDPDEAIRELDRALDELDLQGVVVDSRTAGLSPTADSLQPFFEHANDRGVAVLLHPAFPHEKTERFREYSVVGFPTETTRAAVDMIYSGFLEAYPDLDVVLSHLGGALPYLSERIDVLYNPHDPMFAEAGSLGALTKAPGEYIEDFWYDTTMTSPRSMEFVLDQVGNRLLFGTEYPFVPEDSAAAVGDKVDALGVSEAAAEDIRSGNAQTILTNR